MSDDTSTRRGLGALLLALIAALAGADVAGDLRSGASFWHLAAELSVVALALGGLVTLSRQALAARREAASLCLELKASQEEARRWKAESQDVLRGLGAAIDRQFDRWELTAAEREIGLLLLKGLSHKEIAAIRNTSERTVRQQSLAVYRKSGLGGRAELAAFFLEDLLLPPQETSLPS